MSKNARRAEAAEARAVEQVTSKKAKKTRAETIQLKAPAVAEPVESNDPVVEKIVPKSKKASKVTGADFVSILKTLTKAEQEIRQDLDEVNGIVIDHDGMLSDHEKRIKRLESTKTPEAQPEPKAESPKTQPKPKTESPEAQPKPKDQPGLAPASKDSDKKDSGKPGYAYRYWHAETRTYGLASDLWAAKRLSGGVYDPIWVWYDSDGSIDHILSDDEIVRYTPR